MPSAACHSLFWAVPSAPAAPPGTGASANGGYIPWQTSVVMGSGFGVTQVVWEWALATAKGTWPQLPTP
jgi:hypothetical protein